MPTKVLIFGPENSGKTTLLYQFKYSEFIQTIPTFSCNCETIFMNQQSMVFWDVGSSEPVQQFLNSYLSQDIRALVFVVDASDHQKIGTARCMLWQVMESFRSLPLIIIGNKFDETSVLSRDEIIEKLGLSFRVDWNWELLMTSAAKSQGINEALKCIYNCLFFTPGKSQSNPP